MTSNSSFFDLMRENFKRRYWSAALSLLLFFFIYPVNAMLLAGAALSEDNIASLEYLFDRETAVRAARAQLLDQWKSWVSADNGVIAFLLLLLAAAIVFSGFRYLHSRQQTDFYHSLPVSRPRLFLAVSLNSFLIAALPCLLMGLASAVIIRVGTGSASCVPYVLKQCSLLLAFFLLFCMTALLAVLMTGNPIVGLLGFGVFLNWGIAAVGSLFWMRDSFFRTAWSEPAFYNRIQQYISPFTLCLDLSGSPAARRAMIALAAAAVLFLIDLVLYRCRPSEAAEKAMAFPRSEAPVKCIISVTMGLLCAMIFHEIRNSLGWSLFGLFCGVILTHCLMEIIYRFDFKNLFARKAQLLFCLVVTLGIFSVFRFDLLGYDRWLPSEDKVKSAAMFSSPLESDLRQYTNKVCLAGGEGFHSVGQESDRTLTDILTEMELSDTAAVRNTAVRGIGSLGSEDTFDHPCSVTVAWHLTNGRTVFRNYFMDLSTVRDELDAVCADPAFRSVLYPVLSAGPSDITGINYYDASGPDHVPGTDALNSADDAARAAAVLSAYQKEFGALTAAVRRSEAPIACLQFKDREFQEAADIMRREHPNDFYNYLGTFNDIGWYPVYPSFRETISALSDCGLTLNTAIDAENVSALEIRDTTNPPADATQEELRTESWRKGPLFVTDKELIREYLSHAIPRDLPVNDPLTLSYTAASIYVLTDANRYASLPGIYGDPERVEDKLYFSFQGDHVPAEIRSRIGQEDDESFGAYLDTAY